MSSRPQESNIDVSADTATVVADTVITPPSPAGGGVSRQAVLATPVIASENTDRVDDRRDWALYAVIAGGILMTIFSAVSLYFIRTHPSFTFYLGLAAMVNVFVVLTGLLGLLVKRSLIVSKTGIEVKDHESQQS